MRPSYSDPLSVLADEAANQKRIQASVAAATSRSAEPLPLSVNSRLMDPRHVEAARHKPEPGAPRPGPSTPSDDQKQVMSKLNQMSEAEKIQYYNALKSGQFGNTEHGNMTAALLIEAIITNQINKGTGPAPGPGSRHSPQAMADGKESPSKIPSRSPSVKSLTERDIIEAGVSGSAAIRTSPGTMGEQEVAKRKPGRGPVECKTRLRSNRAQDADDLRTDSAILQNSSQMQKKMQKMQKSSQF